MKKKSKKKYDMCRNVWDMLIILGIKYINIYIHYTRMKNNNNK